MKKMFGVVIIALAAFCFAACGETAPDEQEFFVWPESIDGQSPFYGETLTIAIYHSEYLFERLAMEYEFRNPGVTVEVISFEDFDIGRERISLELMAGNPPVLISGQLVDYFNPMTMQSFADWWPVMRAAPNFSEDDWFINVFDALSRDGRLIGFPMIYDSLMGNSFIVANSTIPGLAEEFAGRQSISYNEMIEIYNRISPSLDAPMYLERNFDMLAAVVENIDKFLDFETGRVQFSSPEFINFINHAKEITSADRDFGNNQFFNFNETGNRDVTASLAREYFFRRVLIADIDNFGAFEGDLVFVNPIPYANDRGELLISPDSTMVLSAGASRVQQALAFDFLRFAMVPPVEREDDLIHHGLFIIGLNYTSPARAHAQSVFPHTFGWTPRAFSALDGWRWAGDGWHEAIATIVSYANAAAEMPMRDMRYAPQFVRDTVQEALRQFHDGLITAEQAANDLQNRITLMLMEMN